MFLIGWNPPLMKSIKTKLRELKLGFTVLIYTVLRQNLTSSGLTVGLILPPF